MLQTGFINFHCPPSPSIAVLFKFELYLLPVRRLLFALWLSNLLLIRRFIYISTCRSCSVNSQGFMGSEVAFPRLILLEQTKMQSTKYSEKPLIGCRPSDKVTFEWASSG